MKLPRLKPSLKTAAKPVSKAANGAGGGASVTNSVEIGNDFVYTYYQAVFQMFLEAGLTQIVVSPGGRSAPLVLCAANNPGFCIRIQHDERTAGFFALGLAKASGSPVGLICTSGTAAANYTPAVVEAFNSGASLVILSADRPPEYQGKGIEQTIHQVGLFGKHLRGFCEMPLVANTAAGDTTAEGTPKNIKELQKKFEQLQALMAEAVGTTPGPIHINCPFDAPLEPTAPLKPITSPTELFNKVRLQAPKKIEHSSIEYSSSTDAGKDAAAEARGLADFIARYHRGLIMVGCEDFETPLIQQLANLSRISGWPLLVDGASNLRFASLDFVGSDFVGSDFGSSDFNSSDSANSSRALIEPPLISSMSFLFESGFYKANKPDIVLRFGKTPISKIFRNTINENPPEHLLWFDPHHFHHSADIFHTQRLDSPLNVLLQAVVALPKLEAALPDWENRLAWMKLWKDSDEKIQKIISTEFENGSETLTEPEIAYCLAKYIPPKSTLLLGNSSPIRDFDTYALPASERTAPAGPSPKEAALERPLKKNIRPLTNRGASGIDGLVATALGISATTADPTFLVAGDIAALHDLSSLLSAKRLGLSLSFLLINNGGGAIFESLPLANAISTESFEQFFLTPPGVDDFQFLGQLPGVDISQIQNRQMLVDFLAAPNPKPGVHIGEIITSRKNNRQVRARIKESATRAINALDPTSL